MTFASDLLPSPAVAAALISGGAVPLYLAVLAVVPAFRRRTGWRMAAAGAMSLAAWMAALASIKAHLPPSGVSGVEWLTGLLIVASAWIAYLIFWGSITRGYTFGLLMTLYRAGRPLSAAEFEDAYAGRRGLRYLMEKRVSGLILLGLVRRQGADLGLTSPMGVLVARSYRCLAVLFGLRRMG